MCSVVGYIGKNHCKDFILEGLARLEYRGYDSSGFACLNSQNKKLSFLKSEGKLENLIAELNTQVFDGNIGIGHTRWSTHGIVSKENAHPQFDCNNKITVVHNGIIENFNELKKKLTHLGHKFVSQTDTEVITHFFEELLNNKSAENDLKTVLVELVNQLEGAYAFICMFEDFPDQIIVVRKRSPICVGFGENEMFIASDLLAFAGKTNKVHFLPDESFAIIKQDSVNLYDFNGNLLPIKIDEIKVDWQITKKGEYELFMLKEIYEQKSCIKNSVNYYKSLNSKFYENLGISKDYIKNLKSLNFFACGTSWNASRIGQFFFEQISKIPTHVYLASEFRYMPFFPEENSLYFALSQSGETADTLEALRLVNLHSLPTAVITNVASSTMVREAKGFLLTQAGPEIAVASTKAFTSQVATLFWLANFIAFEKDIISKDQMENAEQDLLFCAEILENSIENYKFEIINHLAPKYSKFNRFIFLGRHISYPFALEASLKLKEISYIFSQCYPAGELKHGPLALVDEETPIILFSTLDEVIYQKIVSNAQEVKSRKGHIIVFAFEGQNELINLADKAFVIPKVNTLLAPLAMTGLMQFFVYQIAKVLNRPIDKPRNLAKSVTVE